LVLHRWLWIAIGVVKYIGVVNEPTHVATAVFCIWTFVTNNRRPALSFFKP